MSERVKKLEEDDQMKRKKELESGRHTSEYVGAKVAREEKKKRRVVIEQ
jgi:hypothetical protein